MVSPADIQKLHTATKAAAARFATYNFHAYFVRRTEEVFKPALEGKLSGEALETFYREKERDLGVLERASGVNALYAGEKLVVEMPAKD